LRAVKYRLDDLDGVAQSRVAGVRHRWQQHGPAIVTGYLRPRRPSGRSAVADTVSHGPVSDVVG
jgi:hypothetical protein